MPSGKRARQQRREAATAPPPPVRSKGVGGVRGSRGARQASPRALAIAGGVVLVAVIAIVLGVALGGGGGGGGGAAVSASDLNGLPKVGSATSTVALDGAAAANDLFNGIPQTGLVLGNPSAPVEMEMFIDVQCPICKDFEINSLPTIVQRYLRNGKVQLHVLPWAFLGAQSFTGRLGLIAASFQNKGYEYAKILYDNQGQEESGWLTGQEMAVIGASVNGLNMHKWMVDANSSAVKKIANTVTAQAKKDKVSGTPTIFVGPTGGKLLNVQTPSEIQLLRAPTLLETMQALDAAIANA